MHYMNMTEGEIGTSSITMKINAGIPSLSAGMMSCCLGDGKIVSHQPSLNFFCLRSNTILRGVAGLIRLLREKFSRQTFSIPWQLRRNGTIFLSFIKY